MIKRYETPKSEQTNTEKSLEKWLASQGYITEHTKLSDGNNALFVITEYEGLYPSADVFAIHNKVRNRLKRYYPKLTSEARGHYTALLVKGF